MGRPARLLTLQQPVDDTRGCCRHLCGAVDLAKCAKYSSGGVGRVLNGVVERSNRCVQWVYGGGRRGLVFNGPSNWALTAVLAGRLQHRYCNIIGGSL